MSGARQARRRSAGAGERAARRDPYPFVENKDEPSLGDAGGLNERDAISSDGGLVAWSEPDEEALYLTDTASGTPETIKLNAAQGNGATEPGRGRRGAARTRRRPAARALSERLRHRDASVLHRHGTAERGIKPGTDRRRTP